MPLKLLPWLLVPLAGLIELFAHLHVSTRAPDLQAWRELGPAVEELRASGELIVVAPRWAEPAARSALGDELMPLEHVGRADVTPFERAVEVSILGAESPELSGWREKSSAEHGRFRLRVLENPSPAEVRFDFVDAVADAQVRDEHRGQVEPCRYNPRARHAAGGLHGHPAFPAARHECPGGNWHFVGITAVEDEQWHGRRCLWAHPRGGRTLVIEYSDVPLGSVVRGYATLPWWEEREQKGGPVFMEVRVDGEPIGRYTHEDGDGWKPFSFATGGKAKKRGTVEFRISAPRPRHRQFCFAADTR